MRWWRVVPWGFPRFKLRDDRTAPGSESNPLQYRDSVHAVGMVAVLSNRRQGTSLPWAACRNRSQPAATVFA
jgi:hypothetical protein